MTIAFTVASYNILADAYINPDWYRHVEAEALIWETRRTALLQKLEGLNADILCLQEVEQDAYNLFESRLRGGGYIGNYRKKEHDKPDGCATFVRQNGLTLLETEPLYYHDAYRDDSDSGHLALVSRLEGAFGSLYVANTHVRWDKTAKRPETHVGYRQIRELIDDHIKQREPVGAWIVCGDFNAVPDSPIVKAMLDSGLEDAYASRPQPTCNPNRRAKRIDYLFHSPGLRAEPARLPEIDDLTPLPSREEPSDHLPIMATFTPI